MTNLTERQRAKRNQNPHAEAIAAMYVYSDAYAAQNGGSMDFWDSLPGRRKDFCRELVQKVRAADGETEDRQ